ncbi:Hexaprenyldihydroxybenzoate methyltransferase, mitochondrial [Coelomomyces lativittatus]|nr:Hexaprenyldihydroxybenzoate methyltransferase, mitochondrial [Coelomomyces lativittatus]
MKSDLPLKTFTMLRRFLSTSVNPNEIAKFSAHSAEWWHLKGEFFFLHKMNPTRLQFIRDVVAQHASSGHPAWPLHSKQTLDIGCGGGLLSEVRRRGISLLGLIFIIDPLTH